MDRKKTANGDAQEQLVAGIDVGTSNVTAILAVTRPNHKIEVVGIGSEPIEGMNHGLVVDIDATTAAIGRAVRSAESIAKLSLDHAHVSVSGAQFAGRNESGSTALREREVNREDMELVIDAAKAISIGAGQELIHALPRAYVIDNQESIQNPLGMAGLKLEAHLHLVTGPTNAIQNLRKCVANNDIDVTSFILSPIASAAAVLSPDDLAMGVHLIDIGGGTTDMVAYEDGALCHTKVLPVAGDAVTKDIARTLHTPPQAAEALKVRYGCALPELVHENQQLRAPGVGDRPHRDLSRQTLAAVIESRYREIFSMVRDNLVSSGVTSDPYSLGVVLTGGGAKLEGVVELAEEVLSVSVALGHTVNLDGHVDQFSDPAFATGFGLLVQGERMQATTMDVSTQRDSFAQRVRSWFHNNV